MRYIIFLYTLLVYSAALAQDTTSSTNRKPGEHFNFDNKLQFPSRHCNATIQGLHRARDFGMITLVGGTVFYFAATAPTPHRGFAMMGGLTTIVGSVGLLIGTYECLGGLAFDAAHGFRYSLVIDDKGVCIAYNFR